MAKRPKTPKRPRSRAEEFPSIEVCAGGGGQALGLEAAGFEHVVLVEREAAFCETLKLNRPHWNVVTQDLREFDPRPYKQAGIELFAGGLPCPPFSVAGKQLGERDERDLFPVALEIIDELRPRAVMIENVRGFLSPVFEDYRRRIRSRLEKMGYWADWKLLFAQDFGVPQLRPRVSIVALKRGLEEHFVWPQAAVRPKSVGETLLPLMAANGWPGAKEWSKKASGIAPTIVGGSMKHGGPDLGPTRAKQAWAAIGVDGRRVVSDAPSRDFHGTPSLTVPMVALIQGFPHGWQFAGPRTTQYRQVGNAFPPPVAQAVAEAVKVCLKQGSLKVAV